MGNRLPKRKTTEEVIDSVTKFSSDNSIQVADSATKFSLEDTKQVADSVTKYSLDLYRQFVKEKPNSNLFYSPTSMAAALAMTYMGTKGNTASQIESALNLEPGGETLHTAFREYLKLLKTEAQYTLKLANKLFLNDKYKLLTSYTEGVINHYHTDVSLCDFVRNAERERQVINNWVAKETADKIKDLIPANIIGSKTVLVIVNAIYFKGDWASKFKVDETRKKSFYLSSSESVQVDMMYQKGYFNYGRDDNLEITFLELSYTGNELSMFIILPNKFDGLSSLESKIDLGFLNDITKKTRNTEVEVSLPKFRLEDSFELNDVMSRLGMSDMFNEIEANLFGMSEIDGLFVSKALHKSFILVNEEGSEAAAATAHVIAIECLQDEETFFVDHPFIFFIRDNRADILLFVGRFCNPPSSDVTVIKE